jgi:hypothetical protein
MCGKFTYTLSLCIVLGVSFTYGSPLKEGKHYDYSKGLDTYHSSLSLPDGFVQKSLNVLFDAQAPVTKRQGYSVAFSSKGYSYQQAWTYVDPTNTSWIIVRASDSVIANSLSGGLSVLVATVSANNLVGEANAFGDAFFTDQTQGVYFWNGTSTTYVSGSPKGSLMAQWHGRVWVAGLAVPSGNQLWGSRQYDAISGTAWGTGVNPNDPVTLVVGLQDNFDNISALYPFLDTLYTFRHFSTYAVYGFDQTSFQLSFITAECGCVDQNSIQTYNHALVFVSERGVESFNGYTCTRISDAVKNMVDASIQAQGGVNQQSWVQASPADWNAGTFTPSANLNTVIASPALVLSTFSVTENSNTQWSLGSTSNVVVGVSSISLVINNLGNLTNPSFESSISGNWTANGGLPTFQRVSSIGGLNCGTINPQSGSSLMQYSDSPLDYVSGDTVEFDATNDTAVNPTILQQVFATVTFDCTWRQYTLTPSAANFGTRVRFQFRFRTGSTGETLQTSDSYIWGGPITFYAAMGDVNAVPTNGIPYYGFDNVQNGSDTITSGSFTSQVYNTGIASNSYSITNFSWTPNITTPTFNLQTSGGASGPWTSILASSATNAFGFQYFQYTSTITAEPGDNVFAAINSATVQATASTGTIKSQIHNLGTINSFGNFAVTDVLNSGNINFSICTSSNPTMNGGAGNTASCANQTVNSQITVSTGVTGASTYVQWYATFSVTAATQTPTLNSGVVQWFSGNNSPPMASTVWDNRYWLSLTTTTADTADDAVLVLGISGAWALLDLHAGGFVQYKNSLYHSDSLASGNVYLDNQGYRDNNKAINAFIQTKDLCGEDLDTEDYYESLYTSMDNLGSFNMTIQYAMDRLNTSPYTLSSINQTEFSGNTAIKIPFIQSVNNQNFSKCINFTFTEPDLDSPWLWYGFTTYSHPREVQ